MRVFSAVWPDAAVGAEIDALLACGLDAAVWRAVDPDRRHVTLCFHGDVDDPAALPRPTAMPGPPLRCAGAGIFGDALWLGVVTSEPARIGALVAAVGGDPAGHVAHLTVARRHRHTDRSAAVPLALAAHEGRWWVPSHATLVASGQPYRVLDRVALS